MLHPGYVGSLSSCVLCTTCVGGGCHAQGGLCSARAAGRTGWQPSSRRGKCASITSAQIFRRRHTTPKNTMSASKEGSRVGTLRVGVRFRLVPGVPFVRAIIHWKNLAVTWKNHENKGKKSFCFQTESLLCLTD